MEQVRARLYALAEEHGIAELHELAERTRRRYSGRRSRKAAAAEDYWTAELRASAQRILDEQQGTES